MWRSELLLLLPVLTACEVGIPAGTEPFYELNTVQMADQPKLKPQRQDLFGTRGVGDMTPPEGAVAVGQDPYPFRKDQADLAGQVMKNPLTATPEVLEKGKTIYENYCQVCHGPTGAGDGPLTKKFPAPPSLQRQKVRDYTDGRIFHNPMRGQNSMPSYSKQIEPQEIWSVVHYVRKLQAEYPVAPPTEADLKWMAETAAAAAAAAAPPPADPPPTGAATPAPK